MSQIKIIKSSYEIMTDLNSNNILEFLEPIIRVCYKSEDLIKEGSAERIVKKILDSKHESTIEHINISVKFICNRGFSHELVRHRLASFSQESTRYCNYSKDKFNHKITIIEPTNFEYWSLEQQYLWTKAMEKSASNYFKLLDKGLKPQEARGVLPIDLKTEIVITTNLRHWREILKQRTSLAAHPSMRELMIPLLQDFKKKIPLIFDKLE